MDNTEGTRKGRRTDYTQPRKGRYSRNCAYNKTKAQSVAEMTTPILQGMSNNFVVHAFNQITTPDVGGFQSTVISELGTVGYTNSSFMRQTAPIAVFATGRGVSIKEMAAVQAGGAPYDPQKTEMAKSHWPCVLAA